MNSWLLEDDGWRLISRPRLDYDLAGSGFLGCAMKRVSVVVIVALATGLSIPQTAEAGRRVTCQCDGKPKTWIHHNYACEYELKKPFKKTLGGSMRPVKSCTGKEYDRFHANLCKTDGCTHKSGY